MQATWLLNYKKGSNIQLSEHFNLREFDCHCNRCEITLVDPKLVEKLEELRELVERKIHVNSSYRCKRHNKRVGGSSRSQHLTGKAADIFVKFVKPKDLADLSEDLFNGLGRYKGFTHVDIRDKLSRWGQN